MPPPSPIPGSRIRIPQELRAVRVLFLFVPFLVLLPSVPAALPWDKPAPPPKETQLVLEQPFPPDPMPDGSIIDVPAVRSLPRAFRSTANATGTGKGNAGLSWLQISGSGQFDREQLFDLRQALAGRRVILVDLRQEPHAFLNGVAVAWGPPDVVGSNRSADEVQRTERAWTDRLAAGKFADVGFFAPGRFADRKSWEPLGLRLDIRDAAGEERLASESRWSYWRIAAPDAVLPRDQDVDRLVTLVGELEEDVWLHFHCDTGGNRTALFMTLTDMMRNYVRASRDEIIARQRRINGYDLLAGPAKAERTAFLERFFSYCWQAGPQFRRSWSSWSRANP